MCISDMISISEKASLYDVARLMKQKAVGAILIVKDDSKLEPIGIITDRDISLQLYRQRINLKQILIKNVLRLA